MPRSWGPDAQAAAIRVVTLDGAPWFVAADVCRALEFTMMVNGHPNVTMATRGLSADETLRQHVVTNGGRTLVVLVSESGLYKLVMRSDKPQARPFQDWVTRDVLPAIRKDGAYVMGEEKVASGASDRPRKAGGGN